jgi:hypothetical protein
VQRPQNWEADGTAEVQAQVIDGLDRTGPAGAGFEDVDDVAIYRYPIFIRGARPLNSVTVYFDPPVTPFGEPSRAVIFAAAVSNVPEPTGLAGLLLIGPLALRRRRVTAA